jgi:4-hydroxy-tetrahydrodipicolinate synthase
MASEGFQIENGGLWAAIHTPFRQDGSLDIEGIRKNTRMYVEALGLKGVFFCGLMGEHWSLTLAERKQFVETLAGAAAGQLGMAPNCTHHSLAETIELVRHAQASGCHYATIMNPATCPRTDEALLDYFGAVCAATDLEIIVFNTPAPGYMLHPQLLARICDLPNVKGIKAAGDDADRVAVRAACGAKVVVSDPMESHWLENLTLHRQTLLFADPEPYLYQRAGHHPIADYFAQFLRGDLASMRQSFEALAPLRTVYDRWIMGPLRSGRPPSAALKVWAEAMELAAGPTRAPVRGLTADERAALLRDLEAAGLAGRAMHAS